MGSGCDNANKSVGAFKRLSQAWEAKVDKAFDAMGRGLQKLDPKGYLIPTKVQKDLSDMLNAFNAARNDIYKSAETVKEFLETFSKEESENIVRALNGDMEPDGLSGRALETYKRFRALIDHNGDEMVKAGLLDEKNRVKDYVRRYYEAYVNDMSRIKRFFQEKRFSRKNMDYETRIALGMIEDASYVVPRTLSEQRLALLKGKFLQSISEQFGSDTPKEGYVKVPKTVLDGGVLKYGALSGRYIPERVKKMLDDAHMLKEELGIAEKYLFPIIDHIKVNMTVKNPVTHVYNVLSNLQTSALQGSLGNIARVLSMMKNDKVGFQALLKEVEPFGLDSMLVDMEKVELFSNNKGVNIAVSLLKNLYMSADSKVGGTIRNVYDWEDKIFKLAAYDHFKQVAEAKVGRKLSDVERLAVYKEAVAPYGNYSTPLPPVVKLLDKTGISPFLHYIYKSTPAVAKLIAKNPMKYALIQATLLGTGASIWSDDDDVLKPDWAGADSKINLFGSKDWVRLGDGWYWNAGRMMPAVKVGAVDMTGGIVGGALRIIGGETPLGYEIGKKYDSDTMKLLKRAVTMSENYLPPVTFGRYGQRVGQKLAGVEVKNYYKEPMGWAEVGGRALGVRHFNEADEVAKKKREADNKLKHFLKEDPKNASVYEREHAESIKRIEAQARSKRVPMPESKTTFKKKFVEPIMPRSLVKF